MYNEIKINNDIWEKLRKTNDTELRNYILMRYIYLIKYLVSRMAPNYKDYVDYDDLYGYGVMGLIDAIDKFDASKGVKFETYASLRIRGAIIDQIRKQDWIPRNIRNTARKIEDAYSFLGMKLGRNASDEEVASYLNITVDELKKKLDDSHTYNIVSLEEQVFENLNKRNTESVNKTPEDIIEAKELKKDLIDCIDKLSNREKLIVSLYYVDELTLKEIGQIIGVSESRVSQLHSKILLKLKSKLLSRRKIS